MTTYASAGVDHELAGKAIKALLSEVDPVRRHGVGRSLDLPGGYAGFVEFGRYALGLCTDSVGTKLLVAKALRKYDTLGIDCIAMNVNDLICHGAEPLAFVDYLAVQKADPALSRAIGRGLAKGAKLAGVELVGGETAQVPDLVRGFDLAGTAMGFVRRDRMITGKNIVPGDVLVGLPSSGPHANGFSLLRRIVAKVRTGYRTRLAGSTVGRLLLEPTAIYVRPILDLLGEVRVTGLAHITGGGLRNIVRLHPRRRFVLDHPIDPPPIFGWVQERGRIAAKEMYQTFNMGMGFMAAVRPRDLDATLDILGRHRLAPAVIGRVERGRGVVHLPLGLSWPSYH